MTPEEHKQRHQELHKALDELVADWIDKAPPPSRLQLPSEHTIMELMEWASRQAKEPEHEP